MGHACSKAKYLVWMSLYPFPGQCIKDPLHEAPPPERPRTPTTGA